MLLVFPFLTCSIQIGILLVFDSSLQHTRSICLSVLIATYLFDYSGVGVRELHLLLSSVLT